jgi:ATP-dependent HslUV protease subunit HslV
MTTAAWDGITLAADTLAAGESGSCEVTKIHKVKTTGFDDQEETVLFVADGGLEYGPIIAHWIAEGMLEDQRPPIKAKSDFHAIIIRQNGDVYYMEDALVPIKIHNKFFSIGSGNNYAMGAMEAGADAEESVKIASKYDPHTNGHIETLSFEDCPALFV